MDYQIIFLGTGEACDKERHNVSILIQEKKLHLLDCGFSSAHALIRHNPEQDIDNLWISHLHGDHFFGIPQLIVYYYQRGRTRPLSILAGSDISVRITQLINSAYPDLVTKIKFPLVFKTVRDVLSHDTVSWKSAPTKHSPDAFALQMQIGKRRIYYSGDGKPSQSAEKLIANSHIVIHEAFSEYPSKPAHCSLVECYHLAKKYSTPQMALIHLNNATRWALKQNSIKLSPPPGTDLLLPDDGQIIQF